uniref:CF1 epsilon subunit of ATP synthase n=1 Tax=Climaconeis cf. scalaris TaxID=2846828 RepID=A0A8F8SRP0_9STRA|nr:CF1 epsilon subunit of ATP synthase [Climaconeis cf. scalaris]
MVINVSVLTPDRVICSTTADEVVLPGLTGLVGVFEGHATLITALDIGLLRIKLDGKWTPIILFGGLAEVDRDYVTVLVNSVEEITGVESNNLRKEIEQANLEVERLTLEIENAETSKIRLDASEKLKRASALLQAKNYLI